MELMVGAGHRGDQLVVELSHLDEVERLLGRLGVTMRPSEDGTKPMDVDERLGLARMTGLVDAGRVAVEVDDLLGRLRQDASAERDGWVPLVGKNRFVDAVIGDGATAAGTKPMSLESGMSVQSTKPMNGAEPVSVPGIDFRPVGSPTADSGTGVRIGIVDVPVEPAPEAGPAPVTSGHAIFVRSLISREAPAAEIVGAGALSPATGRGDAWDVARAIMDLVDARVDVLNLSLGCFTTSGGPPLVLARALERVPPSTPVVAAAGNHGAGAGLHRGRTPRSGCWPAALPQAVAVGAYDTAGVRPEWSPDLPWVTCTAPGVDVVGRYLTGPVRLSGTEQEFHGYARWSGTSFAAATVTGLVAAGASAAVSTRVSLDGLLREATLVRPHASAG